MKQGGNILLPPCYCLFNLFLMLTGKGEYKIPLELDNKYGIERDSAKFYLKHWPVYPLDPLKDLREDFEWMESRKRILNDLIGKLNSRNETNLVLENSKEFKLFEGSVELLRKHNEIFKSAWGEYMLIGRNYSQFDFFYQRGKKLEEKIARLIQFYQKSHSRERCTELKILLGATKDLVVFLSGIGFMGKVLITGGEIIINESLVPSEDYKKALSSASGTIFKNFNDEVTKEIGRTSLPRLVKGLGAQSAFLLKTVLSSFDFINYAKLKLEKGDIERQIFELKNELSLIKSEYESSKAGIYLYTNRLNLFIDLFTSALKELEVERTTQRVQRLF